MDDPDFDVASSAALSVTSTSSSRLLRSTCHHLGPCHEGHGLQFHSRISPSPSRSSLYKKRRRRFRSGTLESSPEEDEEDEFKEPPSGIKLKAVKRNLNEDLARVERTSGWVAELPTVETRVLKLTTSSRKTWSRFDQSSTTEAFSQQSEERIRFGSESFRTPAKQRMMDFSFSSTSSGSPRLQAFDGDAWKRSPRTGYTYVDSASYRNQWTPEREIPMPHMARRPLDEYDDGEVSFHYHLPDEFSCDEEEDLVKTESKSAHFREHFAFVWKCVGLIFHAIFVAFPTRALPFLVPSHVANMAETAESLPNDDIDLHCAKAAPNQDVIEEIIYIKRVVTFFTDIYIWTKKKTIKVLGLEPDAEDEEVTIIRKVIRNFLEIFMWTKKQVINKDAANTLVLETDSSEEEITISRRVIRNFLEIFNWTQKKAKPSEAVLPQNHRKLTCFRWMGQKLTSEVKSILRLISRSTKVALNAPKTLILLLMPSIISNVSSSVSAHNLNGQVSSFNNAPEQGAIVIEESHYKTISENFQDVYAWTKRGTFASVSNYVPDVRSAIKYFGALISGLFLSVLVLLNPVNWIKKLPKISRRRIRKWRRKSRGPPTRFSARIRKLPVQFTGELPVIKRRRRPKFVLPQEPKESRIERIMAQFEKRVENFKPSKFVRYLSSAAEKLGYFQEEEIFIRRSARLRGLRPEYDGLASPTKARGPRRTAHQGSSKDLNDIDDETVIPLDQLLKPFQRSLMASVFAYFGFFSEAEIKRRRSLRLQGLDPEFEGLTWGRRSRKKSSKLWHIFGDYHDDDEVFFEYHDEEEGFVQRWLDVFLHKLGYLQFEDVHEHPIEPEESEYDMEDDESYSGYVEIPSESFIENQNQHEAFENSYSFEATEGVYFDEDYNIQVTKDNSCLGVLVFLAIPLLLLTSLVIYDSNANDMALSLMSRAQDFSVQAMGSMISCFIAIANSSFMGLLYVFEGFWSFSVALFSCLSALQTKNWMPIKESNDNGQSKLTPLNYDSLASAILQNDKFLQLVQDLTSRNQAELRDLLEMKINSDFQALLHNLEPEESQIERWDSTKDIQLQMEQFRELLHSMQKQLDLKDQDESQVVTEMKTRIRQTEAELENLMAQVKKCCDKTSLTKQINDFLQAQQSQFITKEDFEAQLNLILESVQDQLVLASRETLLNSLDSRVVITGNSTANQAFNDAQLTKIEVEDIVKSALLTYGADKTGAFDYALETAGGSVVSTRCTQMYTARLPQYTWLGVPLWLPLPIWGPATNPRTAIQPGIMPGECWAFKGSEGFLVIKLAMPMKPTRFSLEHIPRSLSPNGKIDSAPKDFEVLGLQTDKDENPEMLGQYAYNDQGEPLQFFQVETPRSQPFSHIELRILNNHGNPDYTCLYRFRVHGNL